MITSFCERNASILAASVFSPSTSLLLLRFQLLSLLHDRLELRLDRRLPRQRLAREVFAAGGQRLPGLAVQLFDLLLHRRVLHLQPLLGRRDVGDAALDVLELAELLLIGVVEGLVGVLGAIQRLRELGLEDQ